MGILDRRPVTTQLRYHKDKIVSMTDKEELLAQTFKREGGVNYFTGMNDKGISFAGNKKVRKHCHR